MANHTMFCVLGHQTCVSPHQPFLCSHWWRRNTLLAVRKVLFHQGFDGQSALSCQGMTGSKTRIPTMIQIPRFTFLQTTPSVGITLLSICCRAWWKSPAQGWQQCLIKHASIHSSVLQELQQVDTDEQVNASFCTVMPCIIDDCAVSITHSNLLIPVCAELG